MQQMEQMGINPSDLIGKIMADPELAVAFQNPKVQAALMEAQSNPMVSRSYAYFVLAC
jgi:hypothetical protein